MLPVVVLRRPSCAVLLLLLGLGAVFVFGFRFSGFGKSEERRGAQLWALEASILNIVAPLHGFKVRV